ncbi:hypothetical protein JCM10213_007256 [Rhodosporidiobolus nylandii]
MPDVNQAGPSLASRLAKPLTSTAQILDLLIPPLQALSLLPDRPDLARRPSTSSASLDPARFVKRQLGLVQKVLVERVWPDWEAALEAEEGKDGLLLFERSFVPPPPSAGSLPPLAGEVALSAYTVLSSLLSGKSSAELRPRTLEVISHLLARLSSEFNVEQIYLATLGSSTKPSVRMQDGEDSDDEDDGADPATLERWEKTLKGLVGVPTRVANAWGLAQGSGKIPAGRAGLRIPAELDLSPYFVTFASSYLSLLWRLASDPALPAFRSALASTLPPLVASGVFLSAALPILVPRLLPPVTFPTPADQLLQRQRHIDLWRTVTSELSEQDLSRFLRGVLLALEKDLPATSPAQAARGAAFVLDAVFGPLTPSNAALWKVAKGVLLGRAASWGAQMVPLAAVFWAGEEEKAKVELIQAAMAVWGAKEELQSGNDARRTYLTSLFLFAVASVPSQNDTLVSLSRSPSFLGAISTHLSLVAPVQRLLGMLVAEVVSGRTVEPGGELKPLSFGDEIWGGEQREKVLVRGLRERVEEVASGQVRAPDGWQSLLRRVYDRALPVAGSAPPRPTINLKPVHPTSVEEPPAPPAKRPLISIIDGSDDEDDLEPYPLPPGPSDATLEALNSSDPALYHSAFPSQQAATAGPGGGASSTRKRGRLRPPVYVPELVAYLKGQDLEGGKEEADGQAERVEVGLKEGEALVRRKAGWGGELKENAVDLAFALIGLQDQYELENFEQLRQNILVALLVACPTEVAPVVNEQYFTNSYSLAQRHTLLAGLAISARELAHLPIPSTSTSPSPTPAQPALFPSKQLPPAMHRKLLGYAPGEQPGALEALSADITRVALSDAREDAETTVPGAAREKLLNVRQTSSRTSRTHLATTASTTPTYATLAAEFFILPLINRFWLYLRDTATSSLSLSSPGRSAGSYAGGASNPQLLDPYLLSRFLATLSVLLHAARHSPAFLAVLVPETLALVLALRPSSPYAGAADDGEVDDSQLNLDAVVSSALELVLVALDATVQLDGGRTIMSSSVSGGSTIVADVKDWAEEVFEREESRGGEMAVGRSGRAAAGVLLRVEEIVGKWRGAVGW